MWSNKKLEWRIGEPGASRVCDDNVRMLDGLFEMLVKRCANPFCKWPISSLRINTYAVPGLGDVCATCHDMYNALTIINDKLKDMHYFRRHHEAWVQEEKEKEAELRKKRRNMGLDGGGLI